MRELSRANPISPLDLPSFIHFPVHFVEHYQEKRCPAEDVDTSKSPIVFPWSRMKEQLDAEEGVWARREYRKADGSYGNQTRRFSKFSS